MEEVEKTEIYINSRTNGEFGGDMTNDPPKSMCSDGHNLSAGDFNRHGLNNGWVSKKLPKPADRKRLGYRKRQRLAARDVV